MVFSIVVDQYNGNALDGSGDFQAFLEKGAGGHDRKAGVEVLQRLSGRTRLGRVDLSERRITLIVALTTAAAAKGDIVPQEDLKQMFAMGTTGTLDVTFDENGTPSAREIICVPETVEPYSDGPGIFRVTLVCVDPRWRSNTPRTSTSATITASGQTFVVTNAGKALEDEPIITFTPNTQKGAADATIFKNEIIVANRVNRVFENYALLLTQTASATFGWDHAAEVTASRSLAAGLDVKVNVNGQDFPRWAGPTTHAFDDTDTFIWTNITLSPGKIGKLNGAITNVSPANGEDLEVFSTQTFPEKGTILVNDEAMDYDGLRANGTAFLNITREVRNTTAAAASNEDLLFWIEHRVLLLQGDTGATSGEENEPTALEPIINLDTSSNNIHVWEVFADSDNPFRSMAWSRGITAADELSRQILASIESSIPLNALNWQFFESGPQAGFPNANVWERAIPSGTGDDGGGKFTSFSTTIDESLGMVGFGFDREGAQIEFTRVSGPNVALGGDIDDPGSPLFHWVWYGRVQIVNGLADASDLQQAQTALTTGFSNTIFQKFVPKSSGLVEGVIVDVQQGDVTVRTYTARLALASAGDDVPDTAASATGTNTKNTAASEQLVIKFSAQAFVEAGQEYFIQLHVESTGNTPEWNRYVIVIPDGPSGTAGFTMGAKVLSTDIDHQVNMKGILADFALVLDQTIELDTEETPPGVPYVRQKARENVYHLNGILSNDTKSQTITFDAFVSVSDVITLDVENRTIKNTTTGENIFPSVIFSDDDKWVEIDAGANTFSWTEVGVVSVGITVKHYDRWE